MRNFPQGYAQNQIWCEIVAMACELLARLAMLALTSRGPPVETQAGLRLRRLSPLRAASSAAPGAWRTMASRHWPATERHQISRQPKPQDKITKDSG